MKKRLLALLLAVCTMVALLSGLSITAAAENDISGDKVTGYVIPYTLVKNDTVGNVCKKLGIDFQKNQALITKINNIADYSKLPVGKVVWLPATETKSAEKYYTLKTHTLTAGDSLTTLCSKYGINTSDVLFNRLNTNLSNPQVGGTVVFPVYTGSDGGLGTGASSGIIGDAAAGTGISAPVGESAAAGSAIVTTGSDYIAYYLIPYTMQTNDTVADVCSRMGVNFNANQALITRINNITNYSRIAVGRTILIPSNTAAASGTSYKVVAHTLVSGEYVLDLCNTYGISYYSNVALLKALNNTAYLDSVRAGNVFYLPVAGNYSGSGSGSGMGTVPGGSGSGSGSGTTLGASHNLAKDSATNGSFKLKVDGVETTTAKAGATVTVVCDGANGYVQTDISVYKNGEKTTKVASTNNTFVMPDYDVTVAVTFGKATYYNLTLVASTNGSYTVKVDDAIVTQKTYGGASVLIETTPKTGYTVKNIKIYKTSDPDKETQEVNGWFTMPNYAVTIEVEFAKGSSYKYSLNSNPTTAISRLDGSTYGCSVNYHEFQLNGVVVSEAKAGDKVQLVVKDSTHFKADIIELQYTDDDGEVHSIKLDKNGYFTMPAYDVMATRVQVIYDKTYNLTFDKDKHGNTVSATAYEKGNSSISKAEPGRQVIIWPKAASKNYELSKIKFVNPKTGKPMEVLDSPAGTAVTELTAEPFSFIMPEKDVKIVPVFTSATSHTISVTGDNGTADVYTMVGGISYQINSSGPVDSYANPGQTVNVNIKPYDGIILESYKVTYTYSGVTKTVSVSKNDFTMPAADVLITLTCVSNNYELTPVIGTKYQAADNFNIVRNSVKLTPNGSGNYDVKPGDVLVVEPVLGTGSAVKSIKVTYVDDNGKTVEVPVNSADNSFTMPAADAKVTVDYKGAKYAITPVTPAHGSLEILDSADVDAVALEKQMQSKDVFVKVSVDSGFSIKRVYYTDKNDKELGDATLVSGTTYKFEMPAKAVKVYVEFTGATKTIKINLANYKGSDKIGTLKVNGTEVADTDHITVAVGDTVTVETIAEDGYTLKGMTIASADGGKTVPFDGSSFTMPEYDVTITCKFRSTKLYQIKRMSSDSYPEGVSTYFTVDGMKLNKQTVDGVEGLFTCEGDTVVVEANTTDNYVVESIKVYMVDGGAEVTVLDNNKFIMPAGAVKVLVTFAAK